MKKIDWKNELKGWLVVVVWIAILAVITSTMNGCNNGIATETNNYKEEENIMEFHVFGRGVLNLAQNYISMDFLNGSKLMHFSNEAGIQYNIEENSRLFVRSAHVEFFGAPGLEPAVNFGLYKPRTPIIYVHDGTGFANFDLPGYNDKYDLDVEIKNVSGTGSAPWGPRWMSLVIDPAATGVQTVDVYYDNRNVQAIYDGADVVVKISLECEAVLQ